MHAFLVSAVAFIVLVGFIVVIHEFGHFAMAKLCGVRVEAFSFGFGPRLFGYKYGDTDYRVSLLPLGGYVKMTGENPTEEDATEAAEDPAAFTSHPRWQRMLIGFAGPAANFVLAAVLMVIYYGWFNEVPSVTMNSTTVDWIAPGSAAATAGMQTGDTIVRMEKTDHPDWDAVYTSLKLNANQTVRLTVVRGGAETNLILRVPASAKNDEFDLTDAGISPQYLPGSIPVVFVQPGTPAAQAGLQKDDEIVQVNGLAFHSVNTLIAYMQMMQNNPLHLTVLRNGATVQLTATPAKLDAGWKLGFSSKPIPIKQEPLSLGQATNKSLTYCKSNSLLAVEVIKRLFSHKVSVSQLMGPVGIARVAGEASEMNQWLPKFGLASQISLQLGILNLFPFPILDGGMILLLLIESGLRRDISLAIKERIFQAAFIILVAFFAFVFFNDISKLPMFTHIKP